jgi:excisionase family DNA binding protein/PAS domain S-box-containing protein
VNLKQAAQHLGVHYQTAYKLVRSGRLAAVCVGARYEISEAAIEQYLAERRAMRRTPPRAHAAAAAFDTEQPFAGVEAALGSVAVSATTVIELAADALAGSLGDLAIARELAADGQTFLPGIVRHPDPRRRAAVAGTLGVMRLDTRDSRVLSQVAGGTTVLKPIVPQDCVRSTIDPESIQYFEDAGFHSMIVAPAVARGTVVGLVSVSRDAPGRPYSKDDVAIVEHAAALVGSAINRSRAVSAALGRRRALVASVADLLDKGEHGPAVCSVVSNGPIAEIVCDTTGRIVACNDAAVSMLGNGAADIVGRRLHDLAQHVDRDRQRALLERLLRGELAYVDAELSFLTEARDEETFGVHLAVVRDPRAHPRAIVVTAHPAPAA